MGIVGHDLCDRPSRPAKDMSGILGFGHRPIEHCPSVPCDFNPRRYNVFERSLGGLLKLASQDSHRSLGRFYLF
jgi:hypothetical protein